MIVDSLDMITAEDCLLDTVDPIKTGREISIWIFMRYDIGPDYNDTDKTRLGINWVEHVFKTYFRKKLSWQYTFVRSTGNTKEEITMNSMVYDYELTPSMIINTLCRLFSSRRYKSLDELPNRPEDIRVSINEEAYGIKWSDLADIKRGPFYIFSALPPMNNQWTDIFDCWYHKYLYDAYQLISVIEESKKYKLTSVMCEFNRKYLSKDVLQQIDYELVMIEPLLNIHDRGWDTRIVFDDKLTEIVEHDMITKPTREAFTVFGYDFANNLFMYPGVFLGYIRHEKRGALCYAVFKEQLVDMSREQRTEVMSKYFVQ